MELAGFLTWLPNSPANLGSGSAGFGGADSCGFCCCATIGASTGTAFLGSTGFSFGFSFGSKKRIDSDAFMCSLHAGFVSLIKHKCVFVVKRNKRAKNGWF